MPLYTEDDVKRLLAIGGQFHQAVATLRQECYENLAGEDLEKFGFEGLTLKDMAQKKRGELRRLAGDFNRGNTGMSWAAQQALVLFPDSEEEGSMTIWFGKHNGSTFDKVFLEAPHYIEWLRTSTVVKDHPEIEKILAKYPVPPKSNKKRGPPKVRQSSEICASAPPEYDEDEIAIGVEAAENNGEPVLKKACLQSRSG